MTNKGHLWGRCMGTVCAVHLRSTTADGLYQPTRAFDWLCLMQSLFCFGGILSKFPGRNEVCMLRQFMGSCCTGGSAAELAAALTWSWADGSVPATWPACSGA